MLKKINRFDKKKEFNKTLKEGRKIQADLFALVWRRETEGKKFGWIVSKKISLKAVVRNKIKRRLATAIYEKLDEFTEGFRGIFLVKKKTAVAILKDYLADIDKLLVILK